MSVVKVPLHVPGWMLQPQLSFWVMSLLLLLSNMCYLLAESVVERWLSYLLAWLLFLLCTSGYLIHRLVCMIYFDTPIQSSSQTTPANLLLQTANAMIQKVTAYVNTVTISQLNCALSAYLVLHLGGCISYFFPVTALLLLVLDAQWACIPLSTRLGISLLETSRTSVVPLIESLCSHIPKYHRPPSETTQSDLLSSQNQFAHVQPNLNSLPQLFNFDETSRYNSFEDSRLHHDQSFANLQMKSFTSDVEPLLLDKLSPSNPFPNRQAYHVAASPQPQPILQSILLQREQYERAKSPLDLPL